MLPTLPALALPLDTNSLLAVGNAPLSQIKPGEDDEHSMLNDLKLGTEAHPGVQQASESFMKDCYRQTRPLQIMNYDDDEAGEDPIDTGSAAYIKVQRQQILSDEERLTVDSRLKDMLHTDVDPANDTMHYHEVIRCVLHLGSVWQGEATSHLFSGTSVECGSLCRLFPMRMLPIRLFPAQDVPNSCLAHQVGGHLPEQERC